MIDCHIHISLDGIDFKRCRQLDNDEVIERHIVNILEKYKSKGIYVMRDGGDDKNISLRAREIATKKGMILKTPVYGLYKKGLYGSFLGKGIDNLDEFKKEYSILETQKLDHLKIVLSGLVDFDNYGNVGKIGFTQSEMNYMVDYAKDRGINTMVHVNSKEGIAMAIKAKAHTIEHGYYITEEELYNMGNNDMIWVPTLSPLGNLLDIKEEWFATKKLVVKKIYDNHVAAISKALKDGVRIALGSDSGSFNVLHGEGSFDEMKHLSNCDIDEKSLKILIIDNGIKACNLSKEEVSLF